MAFNINRLEGKIVFEMKQRLTINFSHFYYYIIICHVNDFIIQAEHNSTITRINQVKYDIHIIHTSYLILLPSPG